MVDALKRGENPWEKMIEVSNFDAIARARRAAKKDDFSRDV